MTRESLVFIKLRIKIYIAHIIICDKRTAQIVFYTERSPAEECCDSICRRVNCPAAVYREVENNVLYRAVLAEYLLYGIRNKTYRIIYFIKCYGYRLVGFFSEKPEHIYYIKRKIVKCDICRVAVFFIYFYIGIVFLSQFSEFFIEREYKISRIALSVFIIKLPFVIGTGSIGACHVSAVDIIDILIHEFPKLPVDLLRVCAEHIISGLTLYNDLFERSDIVLFFETVERIHCKAELVQTEFGHRLADFSCRILAVLTVIDLAELGVFACIMIIQRIHPFQIENKRTGIIQRYTRAETGKENIGECLHRDIVFIAFTNKINIVRTRVQSDCVSGTFGG